MSAISFRQPAHPALQGRIRMEMTAFSYLLYRDLRVTLREWPTFLAQTFMQPVFFLFVFGTILPKLGIASGGYSILLLPGIIGLTTVLTAMQAVSLPLTIEFGYTKEIEDRLLSPLPVWAIAIQKIVYAAVRGIVAGLLIFPLGWLILGSAFQVNTDHLVLMFVVLVLSALGGAALGLTLGTFVEPNQIGLLFSLIITPLLFTGCVQYPWALLDRIRWFQIVCLFSPLTYASEGFRAALVPANAHLPVGWMLIGQVFFLVVFTALGIRGFLRKAIG